MKKWLIAAALLLLCFAAKGETLRVNPAGEGDYQSITAALEAAEAGDTLVLSAGVYDETSETFPLMVEKAVTICAAPGETPVIQSPRLVAALEIKAPGTVVSQLQINFLRSGIWVLADDVRVEGCTLSLKEERWRTSSCGLWVGGAKRTTLLDNQFFGCGAALAGPPISESSQGLPVLTGMFEVGEDIEYFTTHTMEGNTVNGLPLCYAVGLRDTTVSAPCGQLLAVQCENVTFTHLDASRASMGIEMAYCRSCVIEDCVADDAGIFGIYMAKSEDCIIRSSRADRGAHGIDLRAVHRCVVEDCASSGSGQGIFFSFAFDCLASGCRMVDNGTGFFAAAGQHNHMHDCHVEGNQLGIYVQREPGFTLTDSRFLRNTSNAVRVLAGDGFLCAHTSFEENWVGLMLLDTNGAACVENAFSGTQNCTLYLKDNQGLRLIQNTLESPALEQIMNCPDLLRWPS